MSSSCFSAPFRSYALLSTVFITGEIIRVRVSIRVFVVVLRNLQKEDDLCDDTLTSPTPSIHTILIQAARAAAEDRDVIGQL